jgi:hypothetical protein
LPPASRSSRQLGFSRNRILQFWLKDCLGRSNTCTPAPIAKASRRRKPALQVQPPVNTGSEHRASEPPTVMTTTATVAVTNHRDVLTAAPTRTEAVVEGQTRGQARSEAPRTRLKASVRAA